jgi:hypothetical protein
MPTVIREWVMIKSLFIIIVVGVSSFFYTDIKSNSAFYSGVLPFVDFIVLVALAIWFVVMFQRQGISQTTNYSSVDSFVAGDYNGCDGGDGGDGC